MAADSVLLGEMLYFYESVDCVDVIGNKGIENKLHTAKITGLCELRAS